MRPIRRSISLIAPIVLVAGLAMAPAALANPPGVGSESDVAEAGDCELEPVFERSRVRDQSARRESSLRLACGIGWATELEVGFGRARQDGERERRLAFEAKTTLRDRGDGDRWGWVGVVGVSAERAGPAGWRVDEQFVAVEASRLIGRTVLFEVQLGTLRDRQTRRHSTPWVLALEHAPLEGVELRAELSGDDRSQPFVGLSWRYALWPEHAQLKLAWAARSGTPREQRTALSLQFEF